MIRVSDHTHLHFKGPELEEGPLPAIFYFALSAKESLDTDPYNQPVVFFNGARVRIFSLDLPAHGPNMLATESLTHWAKDYMAGHDVLSPFLDQCVTAVEYVKHHKLAHSNQIGVMGLSRGALIATHVAARLDYIKPILGFAPLTQMGLAPKFHEAKDLPKVKALDLMHLIPKLTRRHLRFSIGNNDTTVGTAACYQFYDHLTQAALHEKIRSPQFELLIYPSIGHQGHGTPKEIFHEGARWMAKQLKALL